MEVEEKRIITAPSHPGPELKAFYTNRKGLKIDQLARKIKVSRQALDKIFNGQARITIKVARKLEIAFKDNLEQFLIKQLKYDLHQERVCMTTI